jgi:hypothetical protein
MFIKKLFVFKLKNYSLNKKYKEIKLCWKET